MVSKSSTAPRLVIIEGKEKGKVIPLKDGTVVIGRSKGDVLVHDPRISRSHVALQYDEKSGAVTFTDLKSLNGTLLNGETAESGELRDGDQLQLGNTLFDCQIAPAEATIASSEPIRTQKHNRIERAEKIEENSASSSLEMEPAPTPAPTHHKGRKKRVEPFNPEELEQDPDRYPKRVERSAFQRIYQGLPKPVRIGGLVVILLFFALSWLGKEGKPSVENLERETASIKRLESEGKTDDAIAKAEALKKAFPNRSEAYMALGDLYASAHKNEQAIENYQKAHSLEPAQPLVHTKLIRLYVHAGLAKQAEEELKHLDDLIKDGPHSKELFVDAAQLFLDLKELKQPPEKIYILAKALQNEIAPDSTIGYKLEAQLLFQQNKTQDALEVLQKALKLDPKDEWLMENVAFAKLSLHDIPGATQMVDTWIQIKPDATKALLVMAYLKFNDKNYLGALPFLQKILQVLASRPTEPHYAEALHLMGQIYYQQNQLPEAQSYLRQACELGFQDSCASPILKDGGKGSTEPASITPPAANATNSNPTTPPPATSNAAPQATGN